MLKRSLRLIFIVMVCFCLVSCGSGSGSSTDSSGGGSDGGEEAGVTWEEVDTSSSSPMWAGRNDHQVVVFDEKLWVLGGRANGAYKNDVWNSSDGENWTKVTDAGWSGREAHQVVVFNGSSDNENKLWVLGGWYGTHYFNDIWKSEDGVTWTQVTDNAQWSGRWGHQVVVFDEKLWVLGGFDGGFKNDVWKSDDGENWTQVTTLGSVNAGTMWDGRSDHQVVVFQNKLWVLAGWALTIGFNDVWKSDDGENWTEVTTQGSVNAGTMWSERAAHQVLVFDEKLWVLGGSDGSYKNDVWNSSDGVT